MMNGRSTRFVSAGRRSGTWRLKRMLLSLIVVGALSFLTMGGTYAVLSSTTSNAGSTVATGTLTFNDQVNSGTVCASYGTGNTGNSNSACSALITSSTIENPGVPVTASVTITNNGSLDAGDLSLYMPSCTQGTTSGATTVGGGNPCSVSGAQFYVQETDSSGTPTTCWFPSGAGACAFVGSSLYVFDANYNSTASSLDLGSGPAHGQTRYFVIGMQLSATAGNALQGESATFPLTWHMTT
jgi:hypothetical protein